LRLLITGSSGQIGTNLALRCLADGMEVRGIDRRANTWSGEIPSILTNLAAPSSRPGMLGGLEIEPPDMVVHFAAHAKVHQLVLQPDLALENISATHSVLEYCRHWGVPLVYSSSREIYGNIHRHITAEADADFLHAESPYSASKIACEAMVHAYARCYHLRYLVFRFSNVYGRYDNDLERMERVVPLFISRIERDLAVTVFGPEKILDFTHVDDCVEGVRAGIARLAAGEVVNETINLAFGAGSSLIQLAHFIGAALGKPPSILIAPSQTGEVTHYVANHEKARSLLGYQPRIPLADGIIRTVADREARKSV